MGHTIKVETGHFEGSRSNLIDGFLGHESSSDTGSGGMLHIGGGGKEMVNWKIKSKTGFSALQFLGMSDICLVEVN